MVPLRLFDFAISPAPCEEGGDEEAISKCVN
jgi:hypothetical protein